MYETNYRTGDPSTSKIAGLTAPVDALEQVVLDCLKEHGDATTEQISILTGVSIVSISPRMRPLESKGLVHKTGQRRRNSSGRPANVYTLGPDPIVEAQICPPKDRQAVRDQIATLAEQGREWEALAVAHRHDVAVEIIHEVTI